MHTYATQSARRWAGPGGRAPDVRAPARLNLDLYLGSTLHFPLFLGCWVMGAIADYSYTAIHTGLGPL